MNVFKKRYATQGVKEGDRFRGWARVSLQDRPGFFEMSTKETFPTRISACEAIEEEIFKINDDPSTKEKQFKYEFAEVPWNEVSL
jgi:hypothetical protein